MDQLTRAVLLAPTDPWTQSSLGGMLLRVGRPAEALLNSQASGRFPRNLEGINPEALTP